MRILVEHATIITLDRARRIIVDGSVGVEDGIIALVGASSDVKQTFRRVDRRINAKQRVVCPGLVNAHTHMFQDLLRGLGDDMELIGWIRDMLYPVARNMKVEHVTAGAMLGCLEMIKSGVTTVVDNHHVLTSESAIDAVATSIEKSGLRGVVARGMRVETERSRAFKIPEYLFGYSLEEELALTERLMKKWMGRGERRVKISPAPVALFFSSDELLKQSLALAEKYDAFVHVHVAESKSEVEATLEDHGLREVEYLNSLGVLGPRFHVVHGVWLSDGEVQMMAKAGAHHVHCPVSNMYLASGVAPIGKLIRAGVNVALATDGPASNNNHDMFEVMKTAALLQKLSTLDPKAITCERILEMATINGAKALGMDRRIGSIEVGKRADLIIVNLRRPHTSPVHKPISSMVYCAHGDCVETVMVDGRILMEDGKVTALNEERVLAQAENAAQYLAARRLTAQ